MPRQRNTFFRSNILGMVAIVLALSGSAYAVQKGSVNSKTIENRSIRNVDIKPGTIHFNRLDPKIERRLQRRIKPGCGPGEAIRRVKLSGKSVCITAGGAAIDPAVLQSRVSGECTDNEAAQAVSEDGTVTCEPFVRGITAGTGLNGGTITDSGQIDVDPMAVQTRVSGTCANGIGAIAQNGDVTCAPAPNTARFGIYRSDLDGSSKELFSHGRISVYARCIDNGPNPAEVEIGIGAVGGSIHYWARRDAGTTMASVGSGSSEALVTTTGRDLVNATVVELDHPFRQMTITVGAHAPQLGGLCLASGSAHQS